MSVTPPTATQCPLISSLDDVVASEYPVPGVAIGSTMSFAADGCVPSAYASQYEQLQTTLATAPAGSPQALAAQTTLSMIETFGQFNDYRFRLTQQTKWVKRIDVRAGGGQPLAPVSQATTVGASGTTAWSLGLELGVRVWAEAEGGVIFASAKAGMELSAKISASLSESFTWSNSTTTTVSTPPFTPAVDSRVIIWQAVTVVSLQETQVAGIGEAPTGEWTTTVMFEDDSVTFGQDIFPAPSGAALAPQVDLQRPRITPDPNKVLSLAQMEVMQAQMKADSSA